MKDTAHLFKRLGPIVLLAVGLGLAACQSSGSRSQAEHQSDNQVAKAVKQRLAEDPQYKYPGVEPVVHDGIVQLAGFVDTPEQRQRAAELASHAQGAREIINVLQIKPTPTGPSESRNPQPNAPASPSSTAPQPPTQGAGSSSQAPMSNP